MKYYIADLHLGHANIIRLSNRPYETIDEMDKALIDNWNAVITDDDDIYIVGDLIYKSPDPEKYLRQLKGRKHLILGNHEKYITNNKLKRYFVSIDTYLKIQDGDTSVVLFHYPIAEWDGFFRNTIHLYGHTHNNINETYHIMRKIPNCYNVGADCIGYTPRTLEEIKKIYRKNRIN